MKSRISRCVISKNYHDHSSLAFVVLWSSVLAVAASLLGCGSSSTISDADPAVNQETVAELAPAPEPVLKYPVPKGTANELATFLAEMATRDPVGSNPDESTTDLVEIMNSRRHAADKILAQPDADPIFHLMASEAKLESFRTLSLIGKAEPSEFLAVANELIASNDESIAQVGRIGKLQHSLDETRTLGVVETDQLMETIGQITSKVNRDEHPDLRVLYALSETSQLMQEVDESETAVEVLKAGANLLANTSGDTNSTFGIVTRFARELEGVGELEAAANLLNVVKTNFVDHSDDKLKSNATAALKLFEKRFANIGQPLEVKGKIADGEEFDSDSLTGKVVLLQFWNSASPLTEPRIAELQKLHRRHHESGLLVVGVCLDDQATMTAFLADKEIPWPNIQSNGATNANAEKYGIDASIAPYSILADASGTIVQINPSSDDLKQSVVELLAQIEDPQKSDEAAEEVEETANADEKKTAAAPVKPSEEDDDDVKKNGDENSNEVSAYRKRVPPKRNIVYLAFAQPDDAPVSEVADRNPYLPDPGLSTMDLVEFVLEMKDKTRSIQLRDGFAAGVIEASDRILESDAKDRFQIIAAIAKLQYLHRDSAKGDEDATAALYNALDQFSDDTRPAIAKEVAFLSAERKILEHEDTPAGEVKPHIDSALSFFESTDAEDKHLRMASATVGLINKLDDGKQRESYFAKLGESLGKSSDKAVARYGKRIAKSTPDSAAPSALVGKTLEITGDTIDGDPFVWEQYRGKIVLIDFWATWCGPCRAIMPKIKELYKKEHERDFDVVGISLDEDLDQLSDFLGEHNVPWTLLAGEGASDLADKYNVRGIPMLMLVDSDGTVVATGHTLAAVTKNLDTLLSQLVDKS